MKNLNRISKGHVLAVLCCVSSGLFAQDTLRITLPEAEKTFLQKNLALLAEKYNISIARAQVIQARLYSNPNLSFAGNIYNPDQKKVLDVSNSTGEYDISLQQLVIMAGKRNKQVKLAETGVGMSESRFFDLLRTLRFSVRSTFYEIFYKQHSIGAYQNQVNTLEKLNAAYEQLLAKGVVSLKDAVLIKSLFYQLKSEQASLRNELNEQEAAFQLLLQNNKSFFVAVAEDLSPPPTEQLNLSALIDTAYANRYDLKLADKTVTFNKQNYSLQKALAQPDITLGASFDKRGSFVDNASFFSVSMDLPFFNRNQGNIRAAKYSIDQSRMQLELQKQTVENDVQKAYLKVLNTDKMLRSIDPGFQSTFDKLLGGVTENFEKKNISLIEFTTFYDSYKNNVLQFDQLRNDRMQALEALNFAVGKTLNP